MFDHLMQSAQNRRIGLLREISIRREFATRARRVIRATDDGARLPNLWSERRRRLISRPPKRRSVARTLLFGWHFDRHRI